MHIATRFEDLAYQERLLLWSLRMSYAPSISDADTMQSLEQAFRFAQIELALPSFHAYAGTIATVLINHEATVRLHFPECNAISRDEWHMLQAIAALQVRDRTLAVAYLAPLLPSSGVEVVCERGFELAHVLRHMGFYLRPIRLAGTLNPFDDHPSGHSDHTDPAHSVLH